MLKMSYRSQTDRCAHHTMGRKKFAMMRKKLPESKNLFSHLGVVGSGGRWVVGSMGQWVDGSIGSLGRWVYWVVGSVGSLGLLGPLGPLSR